YLTDHPEQHGGELVVSLNPSATGVQEVEQGPKRVLRPRIGQFVVFDARLHPHYIRPVLGTEARVAVATNFYTPSCPETARPPDLSPHMRGRRPT
ncbi:MAG: 2OG-Fe(II) oxygenase, partial [Candidatus Dormibacteraceae bacterium]